MLQEAQRVAVDKLRHASGYREDVLAVYVDLMALPYDAGPAELYAYLIDRTVAVCADVLDEDDRFVAVESGGRGRRIPTADAFGESLGIVLRAMHGVRRVVFMLDEAGRVLGRRFPRAFQDNLFSMLYVDSSEAAERVALVFSGAQELAGFCEDETSPLGSRAEQLDVVNLEHDAFAEFVHDRMRTVDERVLEYLFDETGGHAGLGNRLIERCAKTGATDAERVRDESRLVADGSRRLFEHWMAHFSEDARVALRRLSTQNAGLERRAVAQLLQDGGRDRFGAERTWHELQYVGVCRVDKDGRLTKCNALFWRYYREFEPRDSVGTADERRVWDLIGETEVALRKLVHRKYRMKWPDREVGMMMKKVLGEKEWGKIEKVKQKAEASYPFSPGHERELMDCMYLGHLSKLVLSNQAWIMFKDLFRDKRDFEGKLEAIYPVRNDRAHFAQVPEKELHRCSIACDDVLVIVNQALDEEGS